MKIFLAAIVPKIAFLRPFFAVSCSPGSGFGTRYIAAWHNGGWLAAPQRERHRAYIRRRDTGQSRARRPLSSPAATATTAGQAAHGPPRLLRQRTCLGAAGRSRHRASRATATELPQRRPARDAALVADATR